MFYENFGPHLVLARVWSRGSISYRGEFNKFVGTQKSKWMSQRKDKKENIRAQRATIGKGQCNPALCT